MFSTFKEATITLKYYLATPYYKLTERKSFVNKEFFNEARDFDIEEANETLDYNDRLLARELLDKYFEIKKQYGKISKRVGIRITAPTYFCDEENGKKVYKIESGDIANQYYFELYLESLFKEQKISVAYIHTYANETAVYFLK